MVQAISASFTVCPLHLFQACEVHLFKDILEKDLLKCSSNPAMCNSLVDGSTETFWESSGESRANYKRMDVTWENEVSPMAVAVHIDNTKDTGVSGVGGE